MIKTLITISIPVLNEEDNIGRLLERLRIVCDALKKYDFEFLFTDNASTDDTFAVLAEEAAKDKRVRVLRFSRNFGFQKSILANYLNARGDAAIQIDADLQDPPELFKEFLESWEAGHKVVYGIRRRRKNESFTMSSLRKLYYRLVASLAETPLPKDAGDFRLIDRDIIEHLREYSDQAPYLRGMIATLGYPQTGIAYDRVSREAGQSKFNLSRLVQLGVDGICSQSTKPLRYITYFGFVTSIIAVLGAVFYAFSFFFAESSSGSRGFTTLAILVLLQTGLIAAFLGIIGEYIGRIFSNVRNSPIVIIEAQIDRIGQKPKMQTGARKSSRSIKVSKKD